MTKGKSRVAEKRGEVDIRRGEKKKRSIRREMRGEKRTRRRKQDKP